MAAANYEGQAFKNGEHWHEGCDISLPSPGGGFAHHAHAIAGDGPVRVGVDKTSPKLYQQQADGTWTAETLRGGLTIRDFADARDLAVVGIAAPLGGPGVAILAEPDGTVWTAIGAYEPNDDWCRP